MREQKINSQHLIDIYEVFIVNINALRREYDFEWFLKVWASLVIRSVINSSLKNIQKLPIFNYLCHRLIENYYGSLPHSYQNDHTIQHKCGRNDCIKKGD